MWVVLLTASVLVVFSFLFFFSASHQSHEGGCSTHTTPFKADALESNTLTDTVWIK